MCMSVFELELKCHRQVDVVKNIDIVSERVRETFKLKMNGNERNKNCIYIYTHTL